MERDFIKELDDAALAVTRISVMLGELAEQKPERIIRHKPVITMLQTACTYLTNNLGELRHRLQLMI